MRPQEIGRRDPDPIPPWEDDGGAPEGGRRGQQFPVKVGRRQIP